MSTSPRLDTQASEFEALVGAAIEQALDGYRSATATDARRWQRRADARTRYAVALYPDAADRAVFLFRLGKHGPWRLRLRLRGTTLDLSTGTSCPEEASAVHATIDAEAAEGRFEPYSPDRAECEAQVSSLIAALGTFPAKRRRPARSRGGFDP